VPATEYTIRAAVPRDNAPGTRVDVVGRHHGRQNTRNRLGRPPPAKQRGQPRKPSGPRTSPSRVSFSACSDKPMSSSRVASRRSRPGAAVVASHSGRRCPFRPCPGPMARRRDRSHGDLDRHDVGCRRRLAGEGGHVGHLVRGNLRRKRRLMRFAREACGREQTSGEQEASACHSQKPPTVRASRGRTSDGAVGRYAMRAAALPGRRRIEVALLPRVDSLTFRPPEQVFIGEGNSRRRAAWAAVQIDSSDFTGAHTETTNEPAFRDTCRASYWWDSRPRGGRIPHPTLQECRAFLGRRAPPGRVRCLIWGPGVRQGTDTMSRVGKGIAPRCDAVPSLFSPRRAGAEQRLAAEAPRPVDSPRSASRAQ
jgi:hypothetical protein